jgi:glycosyltransferase involved in cell wall biosynthesis
MGKAAPASSHGTAAEPSLLTVTPVTDQAVSNGMSAPEIRGRVLIVAYHFPPHAGSSGLLRSLKFCRYLPEYGWQPTVLTINPRAYERTDCSQLAEIPASVEVIRAFGLDSRRHLSVAGRYLRSTALPDRWATWVAGGLPAGLSAIRKEHIDVIFSTYPVASAVLIGYFLHILSGKPWIVDFRDSMTEEGYPEDPRTFRSFRWIERKAIKHASRLIFTAPAAIRMYRERYPDLRPDRCVLLPNGYDEADFEDLIPQHHAKARLRMLHSGLIYPWERDPTCFFRALARLKAEGKISADRLSVELRACGHEDKFQQQLIDLGIDDLVHLLPALSYGASLQDAAACDCLLLLQAACCDHQIPAKAYEYLRLNKPILALTTDRGDTAGLLKQTGGATIADLHDEHAIYTALPEFLQRVQDKTHSLPHGASQYSRRSQADCLAKTLTEIISG